MTTRRNALFTLATFASIPAFGAGPRSYTATTAPDKLTRDILAREITSLHEGLRPGTDPVAVIENMFPQVVEQNFGRLPGVRVAALLDALSNNELHLLAQHYVTATKGQSTRLHELFALRLKGRELAALTPFFGYAPLYEAAWRAAPEKTLEFQDHADPSVEAPSPDSEFRPKLTPARFVGAQGRFIKTYSLSIEMTIQQIYLEFRTAPIGALGPAAAAYETTVYASKHLALAFYTGYQVGTALSFILQTFAPSVHNYIGSGIYNIVDLISTTYHNASFYVAGNAQASAAKPFSLGATGSYIGYTGGDFGVAYEWMLMGGNPCGGRADGCPMER